MDNLSFGVTMTVVGMGGTFLTIGIIILGMNMLKIVFPLSKSPESSEGSPR
ncbi:MAG: OadG-related small transporter subunit [Desulfomonilaceae bacterium]